MKKKNKLSTHIGIYGIYINNEEIKSSQKNILEYLNDSEINDSKGICWMKLNHLTENNSSPVILKLKQEINKEKNFLDKVKYNNWEIL